MSSSSPKMYVLKSSEGETFEVEEAVAFQSGMIKNMIDDNCFEPAIPLPNVASKTLAKIIEYGKRHAAAPPAGGEDQAAKDLMEFDADFAKGDYPTLLEIVLAANYLDMRNLVDLIAQTIADSIKGKYPEEIRKIFNIKNDFTPEEEAAVREENKWAFD